MQVPTLVPSCRAEVMTAPTRPGGAPGTAAVVSVAAVLAETAAPVPLGQVDEERQARGGGRGGAQSLDGAQADDRSDGAHHRDRPAGQRESEQRPAQDAQGPEAVGAPPPEQEKTSEDQGVGALRERDLPHPGVQLPRHDRCRRGDHRGVQDQEELHADQNGNRPWRRRAPVRFGVAPVLHRPRGCGCHDRSVTQPSK